MNLVERISEIPIFAGLSDKQHSEVAAITHIQTFEKGDLIFAEGDQAAGLYVVAGGRIKVYKLSPEGKEQILHFFGPGEPFGEAAVFSGGRFPAYAEAMDPVEALFIPRRSLIELIRKNPDVAMGMLAVLSLRLRRFTNLIEDLSLKEVPGRLAAYLLILHHRRQEALELELDITKSELAGLLGTIPETLSRILGRLAKQGLIKTEGRNIHLLDVSGLESLAHAELRLSEYKNG